MATTLLVLHGQSMNGAVMRPAIEPLVAPLAEKLELVFPDAPDVCPADVVDRLYAIWPHPRLPPPHLRWWDATDDGRTYLGWEATRDSILPLLRKGTRVGLIGFSQGAILAAALAAMSSTRTIEPIAFAVMIAGRTPRADVFQPHLRAKIAIPSLHVWGDDDHLIGNSAADLTDLFDASTREIAHGPGGHEIPMRGPLAEAISNFVARHA